jgi:FkbM family methyltransferase
MQLLLRKIKATTYLLTHEPQPWRAVSKRLNSNLKQYVVSSKKGQPFTYETLLGFRFLCIPDSHTSTNLYVCQSDYEEIELEIAHQWLQHGDCCLDLGANIGYVSTLFAEKVSPGGKVIAVEASPETARQLQQAISTLNLNQVVLEQVCVTDKNGFVEFMVGIDQGADVSQSIQVDPATAALFRKETLPSATLNRLIEKHSVSQNVSLVKMDIEAAEPLALKGGSLLFDPAALPLFIVEVYSGGLKRLGFTAESIYQFFSPEWFDLYSINRSYPNITPEVPYGVVQALTDSARHSWGLHTNLVVVPKVGKYAARSQSIQSYLPQ